MHGVKVSALAAIEGRGVEILRGEVLKDMYELLGLDAIINVRTIEELADTKARQTEPAFTIPQTFVPAADLQIPSQIL